MALKPTTSNLHLKIKELAERLDEPELHVLWPKVWMLEDPKAASAHMEEKRDEQIKLHLQLWPAVIARDFAVKYDVPSAHIGKLLTELRYQQMLLYVDSAQHRCWVRAGTKYPKLALHNYLTRTP